MSAACLTNDQRVYTNTERLMGNRFDITIGHETPGDAAADIAAAVAEIRRIETFLTTFSATSQTAQINQMAGIAPVAVDREVFDLIARSLKISAITQGAFDLSYGSVDKNLWNFNTNMTALPDPAVARDSVRLINWRNIHLNTDDSTVFLKEKGMRIGFGGIGKGYAADKARAVLQQRGVSSGVINASGDLCTWGQNEHGGPWTVGISNPDRPEEVLAQFALGQQAVATSGNYEKYVIIDQKRYSHTINPKTGLPCTGLKSVTVIAPSAELADALTTPIVVMGVQAGLHLLNQIHGVEGVLLTDDNEIFVTKNIKIT